MKISTSKDTCPVCGTCHEGLAKFMNPCCEKSAKGKKTKRPANTARKEPRLTSKKKQEEIDLYATKRQFFLTDENGQTKKCTVCEDRTKEFIASYPGQSAVVRSATDVHHMKKGHDRLDTAYWLPVCRQCHKDIEDNPEWAFENGYSIERNQK